jgi:hypothetical protein
MNNLERMEVDRRSSSPKRKKVRQKYAPKACMSRSFSFLGIFTHSDGSALVSGELRGTFRAHFAPQICLGAIHALFLFV